LNKGINSVLPLIIIFAPWITFAGAAFWGRSHPRYAKAVYVGSTAVALCLILPFYHRALHGRVTVQRLLTVVPGIKLALRVDTLGFYFAILLAFLWLLATVFSLGYIHEHETRYYCFMSLTLSFCLGVAFSANMFTLFIFYELMSLSTYPLIIHDETDQARRAGLKYLIYSVSAGAVILAALLLQFFYAGTLDFIGRGTLTLADASRSVLLVIFSVYMLGFGVKSCIMPLHGWVPDAHPAAPAPASALLSGVILKIGAFGIIRVIFDVFGVRQLRVLGVSLPMLVVASVTIVVGSLFAITQTDLKRRLAYSSVAQVSYIILGLFLLAPAGATGGLLQVSYHAFMKSTLFFCSGIIMHETGKRDVRELGGVGSKIPLTMLAFSVAALGMMGVPATAGFIVKWMLGVGCIGAHRPWFIAVLLASSLLNAVYFLPIIYLAFFKGEPVGNMLKHETKRTMLVPVLITGAFVLILGIFVTVPGLPYSLVKTIVHSVF
jgi:multicomponent Na+:H+ antiporter subunit D